MRRALILMFAVLTFALVGCETSVPPTAVDSGIQVKPIDETSEKKPKAKPLKGKFSTFEVDWVVSHFSEQICTDGTSLVAGAEVSTSGNLSMFGRADAHVSAAWDWSQSAGGEFTPSGPGATSASAAVLGTYPYDFAVDPFATFNPFSPVCDGVVSATGEVIFRGNNGRQIHGVVTGGEVYELAFETPGDGQELFLKVDITGGAGRFFGASGSFVIHSIFDLASGNLVSSEILRGGFIEVQKAKDFRGHVKSLSPDWFVSHFSEQICTDGTSLTAGTMVRGTGNFSKFGKAEASVSSAWDWRLPAAGEYIPVGPRASEASATVLDSYPYHFAVDPFTTTDPFNPSCGAVVSATGKVTMSRNQKSGNGSDLYGIVTGGEVYELAFTVPGDGQELFTEVTIDGGTGRFDDAVGFFVLHTIVDLARGVIVTSEILPGGAIIF